MLKTTLVVIALLLACAPACSSVQYSRTSRHAFRAKAPSCSFDILMVRPKRKILEIGLLENCRCAGGHPCSNVVEYRQLIRPYVCRAGGDAVVVLVNGFGWYVKGVVVRYLRSLEPRRLEPP